VSNLPYIQPEKDLRLNLGVLLVLINNLAETKRNKKILTLRKLQIFYFLVTRPSFLNGVLDRSGKPQFIMHEKDYYTVGTLSRNVDKLFDRRTLQKMMLMLSSKGYIRAIYSRTEGFVFELSESGVASAEKLTGEYFFRIKELVEQLKPLRSQPSNGLYKKVNNVLNQELK